MPDEANPKPRRTPTVWGFVPLAMLFGGVFIGSLIFDLLGLPLAVGAVLGGVGGYFASKVLMRHIFERGDVENAG